MGHVTALSVVKFKVFNSSLHFCRNVSFMLQVSSIKILTPGKGFCT